MVVRLKLVLEQEEYSALLNLAVGELRNPADQVRYILVTELQHLGLLSDATDSLRKSIKLEQEKEQNNE